LEVALDIAQVKVAEFLNQHRERLETLARESSPKMTLGEALKIHLQTKAPADSSAGALFNLACAYFAQQCA
jgi:hypothetical protein